MKSRVHVKYYITRKAIYSFFYCPEKISQPSNFYHFLFFFFSYFVISLEKNFLQQTTYKKPEYFIF